MDLASRRGGGTVTYMRGYGQYCPIARAAEIFAERWTPIILRNLYLGSHTFGQIERGAPGISRTLLSQRLQAFERYGLLTRTPVASGRGATYRLSAAGEELFEVCVALGNWGARWLELTADQFDPAVVLWSMCNRLNRDTLPHRRVLVRFDFPDRPRQNRFWWLIDEGTAEVCIKPPGFTEDLIVVADSATLALWHMGRLRWADAARRGQITVTGPRQLARALPTWNRLSSFADIPLHPDAIGEATELRKEVLDAR
jgi:DNA-binding HxlR family transcriptional regulator